MEHDPNIDHIKSDDFHHVYEPAEGVKREKFFLGCCFGNRVAFIFAAQTHTS
jgi:hypothetical protein